MIFRQFEIKGGKHHPTGKLDFWVYRRADGNIRKMKIDIAQKAAIKFAQEIKLQSPVLDS